MCNILKLSNKLHICIVHIFMKPFISSRAGVDPVVVTEFTKEFILNLVQCISSYKWIPPGK